MENYQELLKNCRLFDGIADDDLTAMLACLGARTVHVSKHGAILEEGAPARDVGILLTGRVQLMRTDYFGNRSIMLSIAPGQLFGEAFACAGVESMPVSAVAAEDSAAMMIDCRRLMTSCSHACEFHSRLIFNLLHIVARKNLALHHRAEITSKRTTREKLMTYLLMQAKQAHSASFTIPFDRQALADYLGVDRSGLSVEIGRLKSEGVLVCSRSYFTLLRDV